MQFSDLSRLLEGGRVGVHPFEQIDQPIRPDGDGQPARYESVIPDDPILDSHGGPVERRIDADENGDKTKDHNGRIEHRFAAARDPARFVCVHTRFSLSVTNSDAPLVEAGTDAGQDTPPPDTHREASLNRRLRFGEFCGRLEHTAEAIARRRRIHLWGMAVLPVEGNANMPRK